MAYFVAFILAKTVKSVKYTQKNGLERSKRGGAAASVLRAGVSAASVLGAAASTASVLRAAASTYTFQNLAC